MVRPARRYFTTPVCVGILWSRGRAVVDSRARVGIGNMPNKATLSGVLGLLRVFGVPLGLISGGKETLVPATHLLGRVCVSLFGENREIPPHLTNTPTAKRNTPARGEAHRKKDTPALGKPAGTRIPPAHDEVCAERETVAHDHHIRGKENTNARSHMRTEIW